MASKSFSLTITTTTWTAVSDGEDTVLLQLREGAGVEVALADSLEDLSELAFGIRLLGDQEEVSSMCITDTTSKVFVRLPSGYPPATLAIMRYFKT